MNGASSATTVKMPFFNGIKLRCINVTFKLHGNWLSSSKYVNRRQYINIHKHHSPHQKTEREREKKKIKIYDSLVHQNNFLY
jgi:hypothetical protein